MTVDVPDAVRRKALAQGSDGARWLHELDDLIASVEADWSLTVGPALAGGSGGFVARALAGDGNVVVLKMAIPDGLDGQGPFASELHTLLLGQGAGYVRVIRHDEVRRAILLEQLGRPLSELRFAVESQIAIIAETLRSGWRAVPEGHPLMYGNDKAAWLGRFISDTWTELGRPCPEPTVQQALRYADARYKAFDAERAVLVHGDAHPANVLQDPGSGRFKLIDPEGMVSEPGHDLAIPLRGWNAELAVDDATEQALEWCTLLAELGGADPRVVWQWAFVERVSTGLFLMQLGHTSEGREFLDVAARLTGSASP
jgi:streptomycin 6-kinase